MKESVCRAFTFVNCQTPNMELTGNTYITIGFFDGMNTERIEFDGREQQLIPLWKYIMKCTRKLNGRFSYQNVFGFSSDDWNLLRDEEFWGDEMSQMYPLTFVVLMQSREYTENIEQQCRKFLKVEEKLKGDKKGDKKGIIYTYVTVDKNDFIVCLKTKCYQCAVDTIKELHTKAQILYSYSIFSVKKEVAKEIMEKHSAISNEKIGSICLRGIGNSYTEDPMDKKYAYFCEQLTDFLYEGKDREDKNKHVLYDILGENDFRYIARDVPLGKLIALYNEKNLLNLSDPRFMECLYSSNLVLNARNHQKPGNLFSADRLNKDVRRMKENFISRHCSRLETKMIQISSLLEPEALDMKPEYDSEMARCALLAKGIWQILQSLSALEYSPTKNYDFISLFIPFRILVLIVEQKLKEEIRAAKQKEEYLGQKLGCYTKLYEFVRGFSSTLNGTLRTDIQFFQVKDYNAVVYYSPAKLRAFYGLWIYRITQFYSLFDLKSEEAAFILVPGLYDGCSVEQIFEEEKDIKKLMLVKTSEKILYDPKNIMFTLAHEGAHFVGDRTRNREKRYEITYRIAIRIYELEICHYFSVIFKDKYLRSEIKEIFYNEKGVNRLAGQVKEKWEEIERQVIARIKIGGAYKLEMDYYANSVRKIIPMIFDEVTSLTLQSAISDCRSYLKKINYDRKLKGEDILELDCWEQEFDKIIWNLTNSFSVSGLKVVDTESIHLLKEIYADVIGILTLSVSPADYIRSFLHENIILEREESVGTVSVRQAVVIEAISTTLKDRTSKHSNNSPYGQSLEWQEENIWSYLAKELENEKASDIVFRVFAAYYTQICNYQNMERIDDYEPIYDGNKRNFVNDKNSIWKDEKVWELLLEYAKEVIGIFCNSYEEEKIKEEQRKLSNVYQRLVQEDIVEKAQIIEDFLRDSQNDFLRMRIIENNNMLFCGYLGRYGLTSQADSRNISV